MHIYCKNCKKHTGNTFPKELVPISKNIIKEKSKCAICLSERTFIQKIEKNMIEKVKQKFVFSFLLTDDIKENGDLLRKVWEKN